jgi:hypothetical protein
MKFGSGFGIIKRRQEAAERNSEAFRAGWDGRAGACHQHHRTRVPMTISRATPTSDVKARGRVRPVAALSSRMSRSETWPLMGGLRSRSNSAIARRVSRVNCSSWPDLAIAEFAQCALHGQDLCQ